MSNTNETHTTNIKIKEFMILLSALISIHAGLLVWFTTGIPYTLDFGGVLIMEFVTFAVFAIVGTLVVEKHSTYGIPLFGLVSLITCIVFASAAFFISLSVPYYDECKNLNGISDTNINIDECINYATDNPDATGAEIIEVLTTKDIKDPTEILERPLIP